MKIYQSILSLVYLIIIGPYFIHIYGMNNSVIINIFEHTEVSENLVKLGDISEMITNNKAAEETLTSIKIYMFQGESEVIFKLDELVEMLRKNTADNIDYEIFVQVPEVIKIKRTNSVFYIDDKWLTENLDTLLREAFGSFFGPVDFRFSLISFNTESRSLEFQPEMLTLCDKEVIRPKGSGFDRIRTILYGASGEKTGLIISINYNIKIRQAILKNQISRGDLFEINNISFDFIPYQERLLSNYASMNEIAGKASNRALRAGTYITANMLKEPVLVHRGEIVDIIIDTGSIRLTTKGRARNSGTLGEVISVQPLSYNKIVNGLVQENKSVLVEVF